MTSTTDLLIEGDGTVPTSQVQIVISSPRNGSNETNTTDSSDDEILTPLTQNPSSTNNEFNAASNRWHRRNSISLPAGLDAITSESPGYETHVSWLISAFFILMCYALK